MIMMTECLNRIRKHIQAEGWPCVADELERYDPSAGSLGDQGLWALRFLTRWFTLAEIEAAMK